jgi:7-cyano-7-deazaguanine reductase
MSGYTEEHARSGLEAALPEIECWPNQFPDYTITIKVPEYTSVCPKTGLPDFGVLVLRYQPDKLCVEMKSFKDYILRYRGIGIFYENAVNRILRDFVAACRPVWAEIEGEFTPRGGISTAVSARYDRPARRRK